jgi:predicted acylesterase/phospholipase RssA
MRMRYSWILDSGGAGRGAWQGGVLYEFIRWCRENDRFPTVTMGASAGGYAAADVATGTERTVMKGWMVWGMPERMRRASAGTDRPGGTMNAFRENLHSSVFYVMAEEELAGVFDPGAEKKLLVFTTRVRRRDGRRFQAIDRLRFFMKSATRKLPNRMKYLPCGYVEDPVIFATNLPAALESEYVRPLTRENYHAAIEASCLVPLAMGLPVASEDVNAGSCRGDPSAVFIDGGYTVKMPMAMFEEDARFQALAQWARADKAIVFCCDPGGRLWENSTRIRCLNSLPSVEKSILENRLLILYPDHKVEAGFLCTDNAVIMRTFNRGREQGRRLLESDRVKRFFEV